MGPIDQARKLIDIKNTVEVIVKIVAIVAFVLAVILAIVCGVLVCHKLRLCDITEYVLESSNSSCFLGNNSSYSSNCVSITVLF